MSVTAQAILADPSHQALLQGSAKKGALGDLDLSVVRLAFGTGYPTGGEVITPQMLGFEAVIYHVIVPPMSNQGTRLVGYDTGNKKVKLFTALSTEAANASDQTGQTVDIVAIGR